MSLLVATSTTKDGSMLNRTNKSDPTVINNRKNFLNLCEVSIDRTVRLRVHFETDDFCRYRIVARKNAGQGMIDDNLVPADAIITTEHNLALMLPVADCIGAVIYDPTHQVLALAHLGRHSLEQQGGRKIIEYLVAKYESKPKDLRLWLTPAAGKDTYQIWKLDNKGMKEAAFEQFADAGITLEQIIDNPAETTSDPNYYSYSEFLKGNRAEDGDHAIVAMMR